ncbi:LysR family transcriptional regulator [Bordetella ansorpii]|uniref:LysR family transcriptional regulator n=1 Tax=Bordetella ansorpii TaxID=288768 RepID=A0A157QXR9_9BORD|nr:LysR family transcriptional regulator [Bordetella ansorpii]SAI49729.1 LysR family transcriptional regulator [Bordetella ansorpii]
MTLKQLEAFYWAATCRSFAIAASRLNISVSSLSKRLAELESVIGSELFSRSARSAVLTPLGEQLLPHARDLLRSADDFLQRAADSVPLAGRCRFGVGELSSMTWMPRLIAEIRREYPNLLVEPRVGVGEEVELGLEDGDLDFGIIGGPSTRASITSVLIGQAEFEWVASPGAVRDARWLPPAALRDHTLVALPNSSGVIRIVDDWMTAQGVSPGRNLRCNGWGAVAGMLREGLGIGILPTAWARVLVERGELAFLEQFPAPQPLSYTIQWRRDDTRPLLGCMRDLAQRCIDFHAPSCLM